MKRKTGILDINGIEIQEGDTITLTCGCCFYKIIWNEETLCLYPQDDGYSQVHKKDIDVWKSKVEIIKKGE